ncbi:hypothetical protein FGO68_gene3740 [Halteria grandinella]|uniref:Uncharacterized protein n=1 Tax=Halteria grandinella TaxID=5974 RepID=A0A8J8SY64_HALGN|nr:hypothetical protein FGO68_gene3740 [Halteria grandinella]
MLATSFDEPVLLNDERIYSTCEQLGDVLISFNSTYSYCQSCRSIFPGCRSCSRQNEETSTKCVSCEAGMYLMPSKINNWEYNVCVLDCPTASRAFVNNPEKMRCEYLGQYCLHGNYTRGCTQTSQISQLINISEAEENFLHLSWMAGIGEDSSQNKLTSKLFFK